MTDTTGNPVGVGWTPGPWKAVLDGDWWMVYTVTPFLWCPEYEPDTPSPAPVVNLHHGGYDLSDLALGTIEANARLIASAPSLYEALEKIVGHLAADTFHGDVPDECYEAARQALSLARGE